MTSEELAEAVKEPFSDLLDAGCGTGAMLGMFQEDYPDRNYTGGMFMSIQRLIYRSFVMKAV